MAYYVTNGEKNVRATGIIVERLEYVLNAYMTVVK